MILKVGNMWHAWREADLFLFTGNSTVRRDGALVMGAGMAREVRDMFPGIDYVLGDVIIKKYGSGNWYNLLISPQWPDKKLGAFQVKTDWNANASLKLIRHSTGILTQWCQLYPDARVHLNFPGIGNGKLSKEQVAPIIATLPDSVIIWSKY